jgi:diguanylate cyclase (GGDEF)-like protein
MIREMTEDPALAGAAVVAVAAAGGLTIAGLGAPALGSVLAWTVGIALPAAAALVMMRRAARPAEPAAADELVEARQLVDGVLAHCGERVLRVDLAGRIVADLGGDAMGLPADVVGQSLAGLFAPVMHGVLNEVIASAGLGGSVELAALPEPHWISLRLVPVADGMLALMRDVTDRRQLEQRLGEVARVDPLTGLTNRQAFVQVLERHCAGPGTGCIALFDIDHLKRINDDYGHAVGDLVLRAFAQDAASQVRGSDSLARISGERFAVILPGADSAQAERVAARIVTRFGSAGRVAGDAIVRATVSAGIALWRDTPGETIHQAERALLTAKARGRDRVEVADAVRRPAGSRW